MFVQFKELVNMADATGGTNLFGALTEAIQLL